MVVGAAVRGCQTVVIGSGPGGYVAAIRLAQLKKDVLLIEAEPSLGGVCLNEGCIPSKALIHGANLFDEISHAGRLGIGIPGEPTIDMRKLVAWKDSVVKRLTGGVQTLTTKNGGDILRGKARFLSDRRLEVAGPDGTTIVEFQQAVIATGTSRATLPGFEPDGERVVGSREALNFSEVPRRLIVVGGGYIGLELGTVYRKLGAEVHVIEYLPQLLPYLEPEVRDAYLRVVKRIGLKLHLNTKASKLERGDELKVTVEPRDGSLAYELVADKVLVSIGRTPNSADLNLAAAGVQVDGKGFIRVDDRMRTSTPGIFAVGDVVGGALLAHKAYREAKIAAEVIAGHDAGWNDHVVPAVIYTDPEIAWVGMSEAEARAKGLKVVTGLFPLRALGRAMTLDSTDGVVKTVADADTGRILGIHFVGPYVSELVAEAAVAIEMGAHLTDIADIIHPHPTMSEAVLESVEAALGASVHTLQ